MNRSFGRDYIIDKRDKKFLLTILKTTRRKTRLWDDNGWKGDQTIFPACVGFGWSAWLYSDPIKQWLDPFGIYELAQYLDEWEGNDYDGTSVRAGAKVLKLLGAISEYKWTWDINIIADYILTSGPVVVGTNWYEGMLDPDENNYLHLTGKNIGGHCYLLNGYCSRYERFTIKNSWSAGWGKNGSAYIKLDELQKLIKQNGEACVGVEQKFSPENT